VKSCYGVEGDEICRSNASYKLEGKLLGESLTDAKTDVHTNYAKLCCASDPLHPASSLKCPSSSSEGGSDQSSFRWRAKGGGVPRIDAGKVTALSL